MRWPAVPQVAASSVIDRHPVRIVCASFVCEADGI
jgi:hypothetical protein